MAPAAHDQFLRLAECVVASQTRLRRAVWSVSLENAYKDGLPRKPADVDMSVIAYIALLYSNSCTVRHACPDWS